MKSPRTPWRRLVRSHDTSPPLLQTDPPILRRGRLACGGVGDQNALMRRGTFPTLFSVCVLAIFIHAMFATVVVAAGQEDSRPNILFIMCDDHAAHAISAY